MKEWECRDLLKHVEQQLNVVVNLTDVYAAQRRAKELLQEVRAHNEKK